MSRCVAFRRLEGILVELPEFERIARAALKELGAPRGDFTIVPVEGQPGHWRINIQGPGGPGSLKVRCSEGTTAQWVREQIFDQYNSLQ